MKELFSPKQVATSIGVSESSLKRWCDQGVITTERTPGGHRRIRVGEVVRFLREQQHPLVRPEALGLPAGLGASPKSNENAQEGLLEAVRAGQFEPARRIVMDQFLAGTPILKLCEELIAKVLHAIGDEWECGSLEVYEEHRACEMLNRVLFDLRSILPPPPPDAPIAMGGTPPGDNYRLASLMVELVLIDAGWNAISLGSSLPFATLIAAAHEQRPRLFWLSFSHVANEQATIEGLRDLVDESPDTMEIVLGGQRLPNSLPDSPRVHRCDRLSDLRSLIDSIASNSIDPNGAV